MSTRSDFVSILEQSFGIEANSTYLDEALIMLASHTCAGDITTICRLTEIPEPRVIEVMHRLLDGGVWPTRTEWFEEDGKEEFAIDMLVASGNIEKHVYSSGEVTCSLTAKGKLQAIKMVQEIQDSDIDGRG